MNTGKSIFSQIIDFIPQYEFNKIVTKYNGNYKVRKFSCWDQFLCMSFAQLTHRDSLRDIELCLNAHPQKLYHMGIKGHATRTNLSNANAKRDWRIYAELAQLLISKARRLYEDDEIFLVELDNTIYALDSTTIDLCLSLFPWAKFRKNKGAIKLHTLLDIRGPLPTSIEITTGRVHDVNVLDVLIIEPGSFYIMDRGYIDFKRLHRIHTNLGYFVVRAKSNLNFKRLYSNKIDKSTGLRCDQIIKLRSDDAKEKYPDKLRRVKYYDYENNNHIVVLTNNFEVSAQIIAELYHNRWKVELFFKWIKQHLKIKSFYGTSINAVKTQIWVAISMYVTIAIIKKSLKIELSLYAILQILSISIFEKVPILQLVTEDEYKDTDSHLCNQLNLFNF